MPHKALEAVSWPVRDPWHHCHMRSLRPPALSLTLLFLCAHAFSQQTQTIKIGVPLLSASPNTVSTTDARDQLVNALNQHKPDKKLSSPINAVPIATEWGEKALSEAREAKCDFVLSTRLTDLRHSDKLSNDGAQGLNYRPDFSAVVEYRLIRVVDGAGFAIGSVNEEDPTSADAAARLTITHVAREALAQIEKGGNVPHVDLLVGANSKSDSKAGNTVYFAARPCAWLLENIPHADAVRKVCEYATELPQTMPNFICDQDTSRYRGKNKVPFDLLTALIRYEDGKESYEEIKLNGKPAPAALTKSPGLWSTGQFGANLRSIFDPWNLAVFAFSRDGRFGNHDIWVFTYRIARQFDPLWRLHGESNVILAPPYGGELWVDQKTKDLLRFTQVAEEIPPVFPMAAASLEIDYTKVEFADGSSFMLPSDFSVNTTYRRQEPTRNVVQFRNCHKFRARTQIVLNVPGKSAAANGGEPTASTANHESEDDQQERIYGILREQAIRDDQAQLSAEQTQELNSATVSEISRLRALEKQLEALQAKSSVVEPKSQPAARPETTLKVNVRLVPVTVVLRDSKGNAAGNFKKDDFELFDNGKPQTIASFSLEKTTKALTKSADKTEQTPSTASTDPKAAGDRYVAYVFDDIHSVFEDLASAREAALRHLSTMRPEERAAIYTTSGRVVLDFTADRDKLEATLKELGPHPILPGARCPPVSTYMADLIVNQDDREALGLATLDALNCAFGGAKDENTERRAEQVARLTALQVESATSAENQSILSVMREIFRITAAQKGSRSIVLVSPGFLMTTPETRQAIMEMIDDALRLEIVVNTLDVRGLYTPVAAPNASHPANPVVRFKYDREEAAARSEVMANLAYSTGGTFFHNSNDLNEGFRRTADAPEYIYILGFSPQKLDGKFHKLKVKLKTPSKLEIQSREGYYALKSASK